MNIFTAAKSSQTTGILIETFCRQNSVYLCKVWTARSAVVYAIWSRQSCLMALINGSALPHKHLCFKSLLNLASLFFTRNMIVIILLQPRHIRARFLTWCDGQKMHTIRFMARFLWVSAPSKPTNDFLAQVFGKTKLFMSVILHVCYLLPWFCFLLLLLLCWACYDRRRMFNSRYLVQIFFAEKYKKIVTAWKLLCVLFCGAWLCATNLHKNYPSTL